jgi:N-acetylglutamate synthase-like GNAT family acetyltransferase
MTNYSIRRCAQKDIEVLVETIRESFQDVAKRFGLTEENAPRHPSNCTAEWIQQEMGRGVTYFILESGNMVSGCVALEVAGSQGCYLERLGVLPNQRRHGFGKALVSHVLSEAKLLGALHVDIGVIAEDTKLKAWYNSLGFIEAETKGFPHLPFRVTFMSHDLD